MRRFVPQHVLPFSAASTCCWIGSSQRRRPEQRWPLLSRRCVGSERRRRTAFNVFRHQAPRHIATQVFVCSQIQICTPTPTPTTTTEMSEETPTLTRSSGGRARLDTKTWLRREGDNKQNTQVNESNTFSYVSLYWAPSEGRMGVLRGSDPKSGGRLTRKSAPNLALGCRICAKMATTGVFL